MKKYKQTAIRVPLYLSKVFINVSDDINFFYQKKWTKMFGPFDATGCCGLTSRNQYNQFCIHLERKYLSHQVIAHEVFHLTCRIMESAGIELDENNHEPYTYLHAFLSNEVYRILDKWDEKIKIESQK